VTYPFYAPPPFGNDHDEKWERTMFRISGDHPPSRGVEEKVNCLRLNCCRLSLAVVVMVAKNEERDPEALEAALKRCISPV